MFAYGYLSGFNIVAAGSLPKRGSVGAERGAGFTVELPIRAIEADGEGTGAGDAGKIGSSLGRAVRLNGVRVLVVDDEGGSSELLVKTLSDAGAIVTVGGDRHRGAAGSGGRALQRAVQFTWRCRMRMAST